MELSHLGEDIIRQVVKEIRDELNMRVKITDDWNMLHQRQFKRYELEYVRGYINALIASGW